MFQFVLLASFELVADLSRALAERLIAQARSLSVWARVPAIIAIVVVWLAAAFVLALVIAISVAIVAWVF